jgi:glycerate dehydrogenase
MKEDNPLLTAPNMVITPHIAWASVEARERLIHTVAENVRAYLEGRAQNVVS